MIKVSLREKLESFSEFWSPKVIGELNAQYVKVVKCLGEYVWHFHESEDEMFLVLKGELDIHFRDNIVHLKQGEFCIVPKGVEHKPVAKEACNVLLFEPQTVRNTGNVDHKYTIESEDLERI